MSIVQVNSFSEEQRQIKSDILEKLLDCYFNSIAENKPAFKSPMELSDLATSILIMFTREILTHYIQTFNLESQRKDIVKSFCELIREQVNNRIKESMQ